MWFCRAGTRYKLMHCWDVWRFARHFAYAFSRPKSLFPTTFPGTSRNFFFWGLKMSGYLFSLGVMMSKRSMTKVLVVKKVLWKFNEFRQWVLGRCLMYDGVSKLTHSSIIDTVRYSTCTLCPFALSSYSGHLRSSSENVLPSRTNSLLNFHHQQELPGDAVQPQQRQDFKCFFRAPGSLFGLCDTLDLLNWVFLLSLKHDGHQRLWWDVFIQSVGLHHHQPCNSRQVFLHLQSFHISVVWTH